MTDETRVGGSRPIRLAAAQAAPVWLDRQATIAKACELVKTAGANGAEVIGFPEDFVPGHPSWLHFNLGTSPKSLQFARRLFDQSVEIPGPDTDALCAAAAEAEIVVVMGVTERRKGTLGTLFNTQIVIDKDGTLLGKHQKLVPTITERLVHAPGGRETQRTFDTSIGTVSGLVCGENSNPLAVGYVGAAYPMVHVASWPEFFGSSFDMRDTCSFVSRSFAYSCKCYVIAACGVPSDEEMQEICTAAERDAMNVAERAGGTSIIGPDGRIVAGPLPGDREEILYADVDLAACVIGRSIHDFAGHYTRPDVFRLSVDTSAYEMFPTGASTDRPVSTDRPQSAGEDKPASTVQDEALR